MSFVESTLSDNNYTEETEKLFESNTKQHNNKHRQSLRSSCVVSLKLFLSFAYTNEAIRYTVDINILDHRRVSLNDALKAASKHLALSSYLVSYAAEEGAPYVYCGLYPFHHIILCELTERKALWIKLRQNTNDAFKLNYDLLDDGQRRDYDIEDNKETHYFINVNSKRANERTLIEVINKVYLWVKLLKDLKEHQLTSQEAADYVGLSKKSLDDYYQQLKLGKTFGFNFNSHLNDKIGVLRGFVKSKVKEIDPVTLKKLKSKKVNYVLMPKSIETKEEDSVSLQFDGFDYQEPFIYFGEDLYGNDDFDYLIKE